MERPHSPTGRRLRASLLAASLVAALLALGAAPAPAVNTQLREEFAEFLDCPSATAGVCVVAHTTSGEFKMGSKDVPIVNPILLQGGLAINTLETQQMIPARDGNTMVSPPQKVPGGLLGIPGLLEGIGGEVTATASLAGPASGIQVNQYYLLEGGGTAVTLPLKIKLDNPLLGASCEIGSDAEPVVLHLATSVKGKRSNPGKEKIIKVSEISLEDSKFAVPAAKSCGLTTGLVNLLAGLPSGSGHNRAVLTGDFEQTLLQWAQKYAIGPQEKKEAKEKKEREKREKLEKKLKEQKEKEEAKK
ncbi:MAG TPA: hypothetical protein VN618_05805 [Solirubrobacteraceae bacterium]|nr:hypothetical protein [Solirubrobacteraceae bacterium]